MLKRLGAGVSFVLLAMVGGGCTTTNTVNLYSFTKCAGNDPRLPGHVVLVITDQFRAHAFDLEVSRLELEFRWRCWRKIWRVELGDGSAKSFQHHLAAHFQTVDVLGAAPTTAPGGDVKAVIRPSIARAGGYLSEGLFGGTYGVDVTFNVDVLDAQGQKSYSATYAGSGVYHRYYEGGPGSGLPEAGGEAIQKAVDPAVDDLVAYLATGVIPPQTQPRK